MPIDLSSIHISILGWLVILAAVVLLLFAFLRVFGHLIHIVIRGCGVVLLAAVVLYVLHLLKVI